MLGKYRDSQESDRSGLLRIGTYRGDPARWAVRARNSTHGPPAGSAFKSEGIDMLIEAMIA
jgi:hypothetical protein